MIVATAPNWAEIVTAIGSALAGATLLIGVGTAWFALRQLREIKRDRHFQWVAEIGRRWDDEKIEESRVAGSKYNSAEMAEKVERWLSNAGEDEREMIVLTRVPNFLEDVALMVDAGKLDIELVSRTLGGPVIQEWGYWEQSVGPFREHDPGTYTQFEILARDLANFATMPAKRPRRWQRSRRASAKSSSNPKTEQSEQDQQA